MEGYIYSDNKKTKSIKGKTLFDFADTLNIRVPTSCRRNGECHECIVQGSNGNDNLETKPVSIFLYCSIVIFSLQNVIFYLYWPKLIEILNIIIIDTGLL